MIKIRRIDDDFIAASWSFGPIKRIYLGNRFGKFSLQQQSAILAHETGHCEGHHLEWRCLAAIFIPFWCHRVTKYQEILADRFAVKKGHAECLLTIFEKISHGGRFHPTREERIANVLLYEKIRLAGVTSSLAPRDRRSA